MTPASLQILQVTLQALSAFAIAGGLLYTAIQSWERRITQLGREESFRRMLASPAMKIMHDDFDTYVRQLMGDARSRADAAPLPPSTR